MTAEFESQYERETIIIAINNRMNGTFQKANQIERSDVDAIADLVFHCEREGFNRGQMSVQCGIIDALNLRHLLGVR